MRTFIALEPAPEFRDDVAALCRVRAAHVQGRFVPRRNYHCTLAFLGEVGQAQATDAIEALEAACAGRGPVPLASAGLGTFGRANDATLWLGLRQDEALMQLAADVRAQLQERGLAQGAKAFRAHITLARRARIPKGELPPLAFPREAQATHVTLFKSTLEPDGAVYKPLRTVQLR